MLFFKKYIFLIFTFFAYGLRRLCNDVDIKALTGLSPPLSAEVYI